MEDTSFERITISAIIKKSGVSRSAFYRNYLDKESILDDELNRLAFVVEAATGDNIQDNWFLIFSAVEKNMDTMQLLIKAHQEPRLLIILNQYSNSKDEVVLDTIWNGILYNVIVEWSKDSNREAIETIVPKVTQYTKNLELSNH
ncbi:TetR/AcrR family transcriptional regulator [Companilactobacillus kimchiensis]|uniref:HTH tetR-type domain-containing protein n=1 Tax=Companilactobacillus kimchiensis TaxID=993692 RepID=A0A0R2LFV2_9LACO|nr:TetR/AcrR family transcriptional regulator [Companilactobacillus kimchiensis]KRO00702.1 hypothetical protein IV57_GL000018 [Companilactobacillus kimchiensis]